MRGLTAFSGESRRVDHDVIVSMVGSGERVLDVGCARGELLSRLVRERNAKARGMEISQDSVNSAVGEGLSVIQGDAERDLIDYADDTFDWVIVSQAIQAMNRPDHTMEQALRIGERVIVAFPNFGYWRVRKYFVQQGRMPVTSSLPYQWFDTPNIHFCTIIDFHQLCAKIGASVVREHYLDGNGRVIKSRRFANLLAEQAVVVVKKLPAHG